MRKVFIPNELIKDRVSLPYKLEYKEFYFYVLLKLYANKNIVRFRPRTLLNLTQWSNYEPIKKYLKSLKKKEIIDYTFNENDFRFIDILTIKLLVDEKSGSKGFTIVDEETIKKVISCTQSVPIKKSKSIIKYENVKEQALKLFFYYEMYYNEELKETYTSYKKIKEETGIHYNYIKAINTVFNEQKIVLVSIGEKLNKSNIRNQNSYIPVCNRHK